jgi:hypothetical protein
VRQVYNLEGVEILLNTAVHRILMVKVRVVGVQLIGGIVASGSRWKEKSFCRQVPLEVRRL